MVWRSLSPRPLRLTRTVLPASRVALRITQARAWADSRAGMIPSRAGQQIDRRQRLFISGRLVDRETGVGEVGMFGAHPGIVEAGRDRVRLLHLTIGVLQEIGPRAMEDAGTAGSDRGTVPARLESVAPGLDPDQFDSGLGERIEDAHRV